MSLLGTNKYSVASTCLVLAGLCFAYWLMVPAISGPFLLDDYLISQAFRTSGGVGDLASLFHFVFDFRPTFFGRPVSFLSFLLDDQFEPSSAANFKRTNILLHLLCGLMLFWLLIRLGLRRFPESKYVFVICAFISLAWILLPIHASTVFYVVQRMAILAFLFGLIAIHCYLSAENAGNSFKRGVWVVFFCAAVILGVLSKESGALIFFYLFLIDRFVLERDSRSKINIVQARVFIILPLALFAIYLLYSLENFAAGYERREFSMGERLLTESRVLWLYIYQIAMPRLSGLGVFHDDLLISSGLLSPMSTLVSLVSHAVLILVAYRFRYSLPVFSFGVGWFYVSHILESTFIPLELYFEHRNYSASVGVLVALCGLVQWFMRYVRELWLKCLPAGLAVFLLLVLFALTYQNSITWSDEEMLYSSWSMDKPDSKRAQRAWLGKIYSVKNYSRSLRFATELERQFPRDLGFKLNVLAAACRERIDIVQQVTSLSHIAPNLEAHEAVLSSFLHLEDLILAGQCVGVSESHIHMLYKALHEVEYTRGRWRDTLYAQEAELYVRKGDLSGAMLSLDKSIELKATSQKYMRQAVLLLTAGLLELAQAKYELAYQQNLKRRWSEPDLSETLEQLRVRIHNEKIRKGIEVGVKSSNVDGVTG